MLRLANEPLLMVHDIQGNSLRGFDTQWLELVGLKMNPDADLASWLGQLAKQLSSLEMVHQYRLQRSAAPGLVSSQVLVNAALSSKALLHLGLQPVTLGEGFLNLPMGKLAGSLGDRPEDVAQFALGKDWETTPDVLLLVGCETQPALQNKVIEIVAGSSAAGLRVIYQETGGKLTDETEHFGYRDGISQVGPRGLLTQEPLVPLTLRFLADDDPQANNFAQPGQPLVWPGQFIFGYPMQQDDSIEPGPEAGQMDWLRNGSLLVFRRLRQDVRAFHSFLEGAAPGLGLTSGQLGAKMVGRWEDGTPVQLAPDGPDGLLASDPLRVNHFAYEGVGVMRTVRAGQVREVPGSEGDVTGLRCPHLAHIRKVNPRNRGTDQGGPDRTLKLQMIRRGIPFGPAYDSEQEAQPERGLLFLAYQTSFNNQFHKMNTLWMNNAAAPEIGNHDHDLLVGQAPAGQERTGRLNGHSPLQTLDRWVIPTGGAFLFTPSISFFSAYAKGKDVI